MTVLLDDNNRKPIARRLDVYLRGRGAVSGFGEAALDRALSDVELLS